MTPKQIEKTLQNLPEASWIRDMRAHYAKTGTYRARDLRRLLGDPRKRVTMGPKGSLSTYFQE